MPAFGLAITACPRCNRPDLRRVRQTRLLSMILSRTIDYALRAAVALAYRHGKPATTRELAADTQVPAPYLTKVLHSLSRAGIIDSMRGVGGGHQLSRHPAEITLLEVLRGVEDRGRIHACPLGYVNPKGSLCALHAHLDRAIATIEHQLAAVTLGQLMANTDDPPLCPLRKDAHKVRP